MCSNLLRNTSLIKNEKWTAFFLKISVQKQATNFILKNSCKNCLNLDSRSHLEGRDWKKYLFSSQRMRLREILAVISKHEIQRTKFSSRKLKQASRWSLARVNCIFSRNVICQRKFSQMLFVKENYLLCSWSQRWTLQLLMLIRWTMMTFSSPNNNVFYGDDEDKDSEGTVLNDGDSEDDN